MVPSDEEDEGDIDDLDDEESIHELDNLVGGNEDLFQ